MEYKGISSETLQSSLDTYYSRLTDWNVSEVKKQTYLTKIDEITEELNSRGI
jgi:hypothetical protein